MKTIVITLIIILSSLSFSNPPQLIEKDKKLAVINQPKIIKWISGKNHKPFKLSKSELNQIDAILNEVIKNGDFYFLKEQNLKELKERYRQYITYVNKDGDKIVHIISFCKIPILFTKSGKKKPLNWKKEVIYTADGGSCYWNMKINLNNNSYYELSVNGEA